MVIWANRVDARLCNFLAVSSVFMGIAAVIMNGMTLSVLGQTEFIDLIFDGTWGYPSSTGRLTVTSVSNSEFTSNPYGYIVFLFSCSIMGEIFPFIGIYLAGKLMNFPPSEESDEEEADLLDNGSSDTLVTGSMLRLTIVYFSILIPHLMAILYIVFFFYGFTNGALPYSLFSNQYTWSFCVLVLGATLPLSQPSEIPVEGLVWLFGLGIGFVVGIWSLVETSLWRTQNQLAVTCPTTKEQLLYFPANPAQPDPLYSIQLVNYTTTLGLVSPFDAMKVITCADDILNGLMLFFIGLVFILGMVFYLYPVPSSFSEPRRRSSPKHGAFAINDFILKKKNERRHLYQPDE